MASNNPNLLDTQQREDLQGMQNALELHLDRTNQTPLKDTSQGEEANELKKLHDTAEALLQQLIRDTELGQIAKDYEISPKMMKYLLVLRDFEICIVCDDSGSMNTPIGSSGKTRWHELRDILKIMFKIGRVFDQNGIDVHFLNKKPPLLKVKDPRLIDQAFLEPPSGYTLLVPVLKSIFQLPMAQSKRDKKLLVLIATDGEPTDENDEPNIDELNHLMEQIRRDDTTHVSFLICTDDSQSVAYLDRWDHTMNNVDVTDDYATEKEKIRRLRGQDYRFTYGDYLVKALVGSIVPELDLLNELTPTTSGVSNNGSN